MFLKEQNIYTALSVGTSLYIASQTFFSDVGVVEKVAGGNTYDIQGKEASHVCSSYLHTSLANLTDVSEANRDHGYVEM